MPYTSVDGLPRNIRNHLPLHAQEIFREAFNHAFEKYSDEETAFRVAWSAVKRKYEKDYDGIWREKTVN